MLIALGRKPQPPPAPAGTHHMLGLETKTIGDASLTRRAPVTAVMVHGSNVAVIKLTCNTNARANFVDVLFLRPSARHRAGQLRGTITGWAGLQTDRDVEHPVHESLISGCHAVIHT